MPPGPTVQSSTDPEDERRAYEATRDQIVAEWTSRRGSEKNLSVAFKLAVQAEFGILGNVWNPQGHRPDKQLVEDLRSVVRQMYEETQQALVDRGVIEEHLYRAFRAKEVPPVYIRGLVESWTSERASTTQFRPTVILEENVPAGRILTWYAGPGWKEGHFGQQYEYLVLSEEPKR